MFKIKRLVRSFRHAGVGIKCALREPNFQIESAAAVAAIFFGLYCGVSRWELAVLVLVILTVLSFEIINTIFERMTDILVPRQHPYVKLIKDMMAGAVLLACVGAVLVGLIIFLPYLAR